MSHQLFSDIGWLIGQFVILQESGHTQLITHLYVCENYVYVFWHLFHVCLFLDQGGGRGYTFLAATE